MRRAVVALLLASATLVPVTADAADTKPPRTAITGKPSSPTRDATPEFRFTSSEKKSTFRCKVDSGRAKKCTSPLSIASVGDGRHRFAVYAIDRAGNKDESPAKASFVVDTTAPNTTVVTGPAEGGTVGAGGSAFAFSATEPGSTFSCTLDGGAYSVCATSQSYAGLTDGFHSLAVRACDQLGNCDPTPATRGWMVDTTPPTTSIASGPTEGSLTADNDPSFSFTADPALGAWFECNLDLGAFASCTSPKQFADVADGAHTFSVRGCDAVGNCDATAATRGWTVDTTAPDTQLAAGPDPGTHDNLYTFSLSSSAIDLAGFQCRLDGGAFVSCSAQAAVTVSRFVAHTFQARACDPVQNCDSTPVQWTWTVGNAIAIPMNGTGDPREIDFCNVHFPKTIDSAAGVSFAVYNRVYEPGVTTGAGQDPHLTAQVGYGPAGTDPTSGSGWTWAQAPYNNAYGPGSPGYVAEQDEYVGTFTTPAAGSYSYYARFSLDDGNTATYCDTVDTVLGAAEAGQMTTH